MLTQIEKLSRKLGIGYEQIFKFILEQINRTQDILKRNLAHFETLILINNAETYLQTYYINKKRKNGGINYGRNKKE